LLPLRIFLTGASGNIGRAILDALARGGHHVDALVRTTDAAADVQRRGAHPVLGDLLQPATWRDPAAAADGIVHAALEHGPRARTVDQAALDVICALPPREERLVIYTSATWVLGPAASPVDETGPVNPPDSLAWRRSHEMRVLDLASTGVRAIIVRPGILYGGRRGIVADLLKESSNGLIRVVGSGDNHWPLVYNRDVGELYLRLANTPAAAGIYHATDGADETVNDLVSAIAAHAAIAPSIRHMPLEEARKKMGTYADMLVLDQRLASMRSRAIGWSPTLHSASGAVPRLLEEWRMEDRR
jgi:nucleoside-diphosphate-sugar epimerase